MFPSRLPPKYTHFLSMPWGFVDFLTLSQVSFTAMQVWSLELSKDWDVLGPFPIHAREQHFLSPSFPLNLSEPIDWDKSWPSSYADGGAVNWDTATANNDGSLYVSFPNVRWNYLRSHEGWAGLQHHTVLRTTFKLAGGTSPQPKLLVHLHQGSYFTVIPLNPSPSTVPRWYAGNIYDMGRTLPQVVTLPPSDTLEYQLFVSGDYEIRLFGDPEIQLGSPTPRLEIKVDITLDVQDQPYTHESSLDIIPNFVSGYAFGNATGVAIRSISDWLTVKDAVLAADRPQVRISLLRETRVAPGQTRIVPLVLTQTDSYTGNELEISLTLESTSRELSSLSVSLPIKQVSQWPEPSRQAIVGSYFFASSIPSQFAALPPIQQKTDGQEPPIVALHGAGVDVVGSPGQFWAEAMPPNRYGWILMPTGRTAWGLDWHGPSTQDVFESLSALSHILARNEAWKPQAFSPTSPFLLIGHSNGGQGAWHLASHYPDRVLAVAPAAAYSKSQSYVPLTHSRSAHYMDPALRSILETSFTPDDNDLHLSNILQTPVLAIHGGADENVPSWHSRVLVDTLKTLARQAGVNSSVRLKEDPGQGHWYSSVLNNEEVQTFLESHSSLNTTREVPQSFELTVSNPTESGSLYGFQIQSLSIPGRLGKLKIQKQGKDTLAVSPLNVRSFSIASRDGIGSAKTLDLGGTMIALPSIESFPVHVGMLDDGHWTILPKASSIPSRLQAILTSPSPLTFIYSTPEELSLALRLIHDLQTYHNLDAELISSQEAIECHAQGTWGSGNIVVLGTPTSDIISLFLKERKTGFSVDDGQILLRNRKVEGEGRGSIFLHPHPTEDASWMLFMVYTDLMSLERLGRLFPMRTGIAGPAWMITGPETDQLGAGGLEGAG
ncbi:hypothetical protein CC2G_005880 [Coprinopsis cinerea AmutBmut pab1-1]|nr:hypothetical protein CC2G_005880 [Coprinopsis cinerea AmutBmut pab1-1]